MGKPEDTREMLSDTMKELFPARVEISRRHHEILQTLSGKTGRSVKEIVRQAIDGYLQAEGLQTQGSK